MDKLWQDIKDFHAKFGLEAPSKPEALEASLAAMRINFMYEEWTEYIDAEVVGDKAEMFDALIDLVYVALGTAYLHGFDFMEGWNRVHAANMQKVRASSAEDSKRNHESDVVKPEGWVAPDLTDLV